MELKELPNIGKVLSCNLEKVGVDNAEKLREIGAKEAFKRIREKVDPGACIMMLYALEGAVEGIPSNSLSSAKKDELKVFINRL
jgi:DNA transformation protein